MGALTTIQAKRLLDDFVDSWDPKDLVNEFYEDAVSRETVRDVWRKYYRLRAIYDMKCTCMAVEVGWCWQVPNCYQLLLLWL